MSPTPLKPLTLPDDITSGYWEAAREGRLAVQYCPGCARYVHLPTGHCPGCDTDTLEWRTVSGRATLYSYTVVHDAPAPGFADSLPYLVGVVELEEQDGLLVTTNLVDVDPADLRIGLDLDVTFDELAPGATVPQFRQRKA